MTQGRPGDASDVVDDAAKRLAQNIADQPPDVQAVLRYLYGRVAIDLGLLEVIGIETRLEGDRLVCRSADGALRNVDRPRDLEWTTQQEDRYVTKLKAMLNPAELPRG